LRLGEKIYLPLTTLMVEELRAFGYELRREMEDAKNGPGARKKLTCRRAPESHGEAPGRQVRRR